MKESTAIVPEVVDANITISDIDNLCHRLKGYLANDPDILSAQVVIDEYEKAKIPTCKSSGDAEVYKTMSDIIKQEARSVEDSRKAIKDPVTKIGKMIDTAYGDKKKALEAIAKRYTVKLGDWDLKQRELDREKQRKLDEKAAAKAALRQAKIDAERKRLAELEAAATADRDALESEAENEKRLAEIEAEKERAEEALAEIAQAPPPAPAPIIPKSKPTVRMYWRLQVTDPTAFLKAIITGKVAFIDLNEIVQFKSSGMNKLAGIIKDKMEIPGVRAYETPDGKDG